MKKKWIGTHDGQKRGKKFQKPGKPNAKAMARLARRVRKYTADMTRNVNRVHVDPLHRPSVVLPLQKPGSQTK